MVLWTAAEAARNAAAELMAGGRLSGAYRCLMQLLDDYRRAQRQDGTPAAARLFDDPPAGTGDVRVDAALAGLAEHLARHDGWQPPLWVFDESRNAKTWWFVSGVRSWHAMALVESPLAFRAEVFLVGGAAMALAYDARRATRDLDAIFQPKEEVYEAAAAVAARYDLPADWLNDGRILIVTLLYLRLVACSGPQRRPPARPVRRRRSQLGPATVRIHPARLDVTQLQTTHQQPTRPTRSVYRISIGRKRRRLAATPRHRYV